MLCVTLLTKWLKGQEFRFGLPHTWAITRIRLLCSEAEVGKIGMAFGEIDASGQARRLAPLTTMHAVLLEAASQQNA